MGHAQRLLLVGLSVFMWAGCGGASCDDLREVCAACPDTTEGRQAASSCMTAVDSGDELACEDRLDTGVYETAGCVP